MSELQPRIGLIRWIVFIGGSIIGMVFVWFLVLIVGLNPNVFQWDSFRLWTWLGMGVGIGFVLLLRFIYEIEQK